jgi:hypothetical protein
MHCKIRRTSLESRVSDVSTTYTWPKRAFHLQQQLKEASGQDTARTADDAPSSAAQDKIAVVKLLMG